MGVTLGKIKTCFARPSIRGRHDSAAVLPTARRRDAREPKQATLECPLRSCRFAVRLRSWRRGQVPCFRASAEACSMAPTRSMLPQAEAWHRPHWPPGPKQASATESGSFAAALQGPHSVPQRPLKKVAHCRLAMGDWRLAGAMPGAGNVPGSETQPGQAAGEADRAQPGRPGALAGRPAGAGARHGAFNDARGRRLKPPGHRDQQPKKQQQNTDP